MDLDAWLQTDLGADETKELYRYFMRPEPKVILSDIEVDEETGQRSRMIAVGMVRNSKDKKATRVYLDPFPHIRIEKAKALQGWYKAKAEKAGVRNRPCFTDAILTEPYGGYCAVGCAFCYINSGTRGYRGSGLISVPMDYGQQVRKMLGRMKTSAAGYFSSFTDPFTPLEDVYHNTQEGAQAFVDAGLPIFFLSRLPYPGWAIDQMRQSPYSYAQKSINTADESTWKKLSPGSPSLAHHMDEIRELRKQGIYVSIQLNPVVPGIVDHDDVLATISMLADAGANHIIVKFVEAGYSWAPEMVKRMVQRFGVNRAGTFARLFTENMGGQKCVQEAYRMEGHMLYSKAARACGLTYATCYEYAYERDDKGDILNKTGVSIGRDFLTADQCHGHRVPMFSRDETDQPFREVTECPPSGCLYCAEPEPACGSELYGQAKALRMGDLKRSVWEKRDRRHLRVVD